MADRTIEFHPDLSDAVRARIDALFGQWSASGSPPDAIAAAFKALDLTIEDITPCATWDEGDRVRCELARAPSFVLLALFWDRAITPIHDHDESDCGFRLLRGELEETRFRVVPSENDADSDDGGAQKRVVEVARRLLPMGDVAKSSRGAIHRLRVPEGGPDRAVSLHAYSPALECECMGVYEEIAAGASASR